jgi:hypothetical protein
MTGSERDVLVEERAYRILNDSRAAAAHTKYVEAQLRYRVIRDLLARLRALARVIVVVLATLLSVGILCSYVPGTLVAEKTIPRREQ